MGRDLPRAEPGGFLFKFFVRVLFGSVSDGSFLMFCQFVGVSGSPKRGHVWCIFVKNSVSGDKGASIFKHIYSVLVRF